MPRFDKLLILDLDETLIWSDQDEDAADFRVGEYAVTQRPYLEMFLATCLEWFTVGIWTTGTEEYARAILAHLLPNIDILHCLYCADRCTLALNPMTGLLELTKPLRKIKGFPLERIIICDDRPETALRNYGNLVQVPPFTGNAHDRVLPLLLKFLETLGGAPNVRAIEKRSWLHDVK
jgi:TFIIF-interacting CTD phosphatase-like protein